LRVIWSDQSEDCHRANVADRIAPLKIRTNRDHVRGHCVGWRAHVSAIEPAGCGYWRRAAEKEVFFTIADGHKQCPLGAYTHNVPQSPAEQQELMGPVQTTVGLSYLKMEEVPQIPPRKTPLQVAV
jgi:hypothetical protein